MNIYFIFPDIYLLKIIYFFYIEEFIKILHQQGHTVSIILISPNIHQKQEDFFKYIVNFKIMNITIFQRLITNNAKFIFIQSIIYKQLINKIRPNNLFLLNTEQGSNGFLTDTIRNTILEILNLGGTVIDYSPSNRSFLHRYDNKYRGNYECLEPYFSTKSNQLQDKNIQLLSLIGNSQYRYEKSKELDIAVADLNGNWMYEADNLFRNSKYLINFHFNPNNYTILETIRVYHALARGCIVLSEKCHEAELCNLSKHIYFFNSADEFKEIYNRIEENYENIIKKQIETLDFTEIYRKYIYFIQRYLRN